MVKRYTADLDGNMGRPERGTGFMFDDRFGAGPVTGQQTGRFGLQGPFAEYVDPSAMGINTTGYRNLDEIMHSASIPSSYRPDLALPTMGRPSPTAPAMVSAPMPPPAFSGQMAREAAEAERGATRGTTTMASSPTPPDPRLAGEARMINMFERGRGLANAPMPPQRMGTTLTSTPLPPAHPFKGIGGLDLAMPTAGAPPSAFAGQTVRGAPNPDVNAAMGARSKRPDFFSAIMGRPGSSVGPVRSSPSTPSNNYHAGNSYGGQDATSFNNMDSQYY